MSTPIDDGGSAFPWKVDMKKGDTVNGKLITKNSSHIEAGMTIRDFAAIKFIAAILANPASYDKDGNWLNEHETAAEMGIEIADDFIAERNKSREATK